MPLAVFVIAANEPPCDRRKKATGPVGAQSGAQSDAVLLALSDTPLSASELTHVLGPESKTGVDLGGGLIKKRVSQGMIDRHSRPRARFLEE